jgi:fibronectin type 3 domain-containing protein
LTGYNIYRASSPSGPFTLVGTAGAAATGFIDSTVAVATYYYEVTAVATGGVESVVSNVAPVTIP